MKRKVIQLAGSTLVVSLPSKWARQYGVKKGDELDLEPGPRTLRIALENKIEVKKFSVDITNLAPMIKRILGSLYKAGYDEFEVQFGNMSELAIVQEVVREEFIGFEVIHQGKNGLTVKEISNVDPGEFNTIMRRMFLIVISMADDSLQAIRARDKEWLKLIVLRDKDTNKLADFCRRILNKGNTIEDYRSSPLYFIVEQLEKIGDVYRDICKYGIDNRINVGRDMQEIYEGINQYLRDFYQLYYNFNLKDISDFGKKRQELINKIEKTYLRLRPGQLRLLFYLNISFENVFDMNGPLMASRL